MLFPGIDVSDCGLEMTTKLQPLDTVRFRSFVDMLHGIVDRNRPSGLGTDRDPYVSN